MTVRIGMIGAGGIAMQHLEKLAQIDNVEIVGISDVNKEQAEKVANQYNATVFEEVDDLVSPDKIDALFVCTPPFVRGEIEEIAAKRGIHLFVEKPIGLDLETVERKAKIIKESGVVNASGYSLRYLDTVQEAKSYLKNKQIDLVLAKRIGGLHVPSWWRDVKRSGGPFVEQTTHQVDMIRYLAGEIAEVNGRFEQRSVLQDDPTATINDTGAVEFELESGALGNISYSCVSHHFYKAEVEIFGRNFYVQIDSDYLRIVDDKVDKSFVSRIDKVLEQDKRFIQAIESGRPDDVLCDYAEALRTLKVTLDAEQPAMEKQSNR